MIVEWNLRFKLITACRQQLFDLQMHRLNIILPCEKQSAFESTSFLLLFDIVIRINMFICMTPANGTSIVMYIQKLSNSNFRCISIILVLVLKSENTCISMDMFFEGFFFKTQTIKKQKRHSIFCVMFSNL